MFRETAIPSLWKVISGDSRSNGNALVTLDAATSAILALDNDRGGKVVFSKMSNQVQPFGRCDQKVARISRLERRYRSGPETFSMDPKARTDRFIEASKDLNAIPVV